jgi:hypothetical protein
MKEFKFFNGNPKDATSDVSIDFNKIFDSMRPTLSKDGQDQILTSSILKELNFGLECIYRINNKKTKNADLTDYSFPNATTKKLNTIVSDITFLKKLIEISEIINLATTAFKALNADIKLFLKKGRGIDTEYIVARATIQSFEYVNGERKATTKRFSAHVGLLSNYPKGLKDKQAIKDALPKLYNKILKTDYFKS